jgi:hypothetical protein
MTHDVSGKKKNLGAKKKIWEEKKLGAKKNPEQKKKLEQKKNFGSKKATYGKREWFVHHFNPFCSSEKEEEVLMRGAAEPNCERSEHLPSVKKKLGDVALAPKMTRRQTLNAS